MNNDNVSDDIIEKANEEVSDNIEEPMTLEEFLDDVIEDSDLCRTAHQYLLDAIENFGRRKVFERGEEKQRYRFFDDPSNDGEHAVLGNTDMLNRFVDELRMIANSDDRMQKIILFNGPTATGKSELKRCIINGLREYSKTDDGKRYTCEWNISNLNSSGRLSYGDNDSETLSNDWFESPVQINPISVLPKNIRSELIESLESDYIIPRDIELDPFSQEVYDYLIKNYSGSDDVFTKATGDNHLRVRRYTMDETKGIGILTAEDDGSVKDRLLGSWMPSMIKELNSKGRKDPRAFSYDGVLSQGNSGVMVVEDATKHADILMHLLNVPDESHAKIDKEIGFDIDTVPIFISNPDLVEQKLSPNNRPDMPIENTHESDPLKAIKRRILQYEFRYLTSLSDESKLIRKEVNGFKVNDIDTNYKEPLFINDIEFAPHTIEAAAMYDVVSRLSIDDDNNKLDPTDKAMLYDRGYINENGEKIDISEFNIDDSRSDGKFGIPVTYTRDIIRSLVHSADSENDVYLPEDVINELVNGVNNAPVFTEKERQRYSNRSNDVINYIDKQQQKDVIQSILYDRQASESAIKEYIDHLYAWEDNKDEYDKLLLKDFETKHLGASEDNYNSDNSPQEEVKSLRLNQVIKPLNRHHWKQKNKDFEVKEVELKDVPMISSILGEYDWSDVFTMYENLSPVNWENPAENTPTYEVKQKCIENMVKEFDYTEESARMTSEKVFNRSQKELEKLSK